MFLHRGHNLISFHFGLLSVIMLLFLEANGTVVLIFSVCTLVDEDKRLVQDA